MQNLRKNTDREISAIREYGIEGYFLIEGERGREERKTMGKGKKKRGGKEIREKRYISRNWGRGGWGVCPERSQPTQMNEILPKDSPNSFSRCQTTCRELSLLQPARKIPLTLSFLLLKVLYPFSAIFLIDISFL